MKKRSVVLMHVEVNLNFFATRRDMFFDGTFLNGEDHEDPWTS